VDLVYSPLTHYPLVKDAEHAECERLQLCLEPYV